MGPVQIRFGRSARKHRIGKARARFVMENSQPSFVPATDERDQQLQWIGIDQNGVELEIVAVEKPDALLVIHVMPTHFRRRG